MRPELEKALGTLKPGRREDLERALALLQDTVFSFSFKVCGHRQDAEDTMQETLLRAAASLPRFDSPKALAVWLYKVAKTRCLMSRRKSKFAPKEELSLEVLMPDRAELERLAKGGAPHPERLLLAGESAERVRQAVLKLPPEYRLALVLHDMEELSTEEIARVLGVREGTVRVRLHRARVFVRNALARADGGAKAREKIAPPRPMGCKDLFASLSDYLDGQLDVRHCAALEKHLDGCNPCLMFLESLRQTVERLKKQKPGTLDPARAARTRAELLAAYRKAVEAVAGREKRGNRK